MLVSEEIMSFRRNYGWMPTPSSGGAVAASSLPVFLVSFSSLKLGCAFTYLFWAIFFWEF